MDEIREEIDELEYKIDYYKDHMQCFDPEGEYYIEYQELVERLEDRLEYLTSSGKKQKLAEKYEEKVRAFEESEKERLQKEIEKLEEETKNNDKITLNIAFNYGSRAEIVDAVNRIIKDGKENITEEDFSKYLYNDFPDPDLVIRTSGEMRISNFLLWQIAYSEFYITDTLWPDFDEKEIDKAIESYNQRERRFGGVKNV